MLSLLVLCITGFVLFIVGGNLSRDKLFLGGLALFTVAFIVGMLSVESSRSKIPEGYEKLDSYYYIAETGDIREIEGPFYYNSEDGIYYTQTLGNAFWLPFGTPDYEPVDLPESNTIKNDSTATTQCPNCQFSCTTPYCGNYGTKIPQE